MINAVNVDEIKVDVVAVSDGRATVTLANSLGEAFANMSITTPPSVATPIGVMSPPKASSVQSTPSRSQRSASPTLSVRSVQSVSLPVVSITPGKL